MNNFKVGDYVRLKASVSRKRGDKKTNKIAKIILFYSDIEGGVRLDRPIQDFVSWNVLDLKKA